MIWHLLPLSGWQRAQWQPGQGRPAGATGYVPGTGEAVPFVHASPDDEAVTLAVAGAFFGDLAEPLVALGLAEDRLSAPVRFEPPDPAPPPGVPAGTLFPHVYGPVELAAVAEVRYARRDPAGRYTGLEARPATAEALDLFPHPEGGWYRQTWAAGPSYTPAGYPGPRAAATAIYFLLPPGAHSRWHTVRSGELWLWHAGGPLTLLLGGTGPHPAAAPGAVALGPDLAGGQHLQYLVPAGCWQAARPAGPAEVLVGCVVAPGFDFADFTVLPDG
jgi:predicted cupin superfamily sugar epimerase/uncharacterized protein (DUF952 family)